MVYEINRHLFDKSEHILMTTTNHYDFYSRIIS